MSALTAILPDCEHGILTACDGSQIVGTLPFYIKANDFGRVLNSLPYFGGHGDFLIADGVGNPRAVATALADGLKELCRERSIGSLNIVSHPIKSMIGSCKDQIGLTPWDFRTGQISNLPSASNREEALDLVLSNCHQKTRNLVRKGLRQGFTIEVSEDDQDWREMIEHHRIGLEKIGGKAKSADEFGAIRRYLGSGDRRRLYVAKSDGEFAGALLNLYYRNWVEYFTPVSVEAFRNRQVLSALIVTAMVDAVLEGRTRWNWGGTWSTQAGVHHFKKGWGAVDHIYHYFGAVSDPGLLNAGTSILLEKFPNFYVRPFNKNKSGETLES